MQLNNDLLGITTLYATTKVTLDLLGWFAPMEMYAPSPIWKRKALREARGLIVDDDVVADQWYPYYLIQNRTYWGDVMEIDVKRKHVTSWAIDVIFDHFVEFLWRDRTVYAIRQRADFELILMPDDNHMGPIPIGNLGRKVRRVVDGPYGEDRIVLLLDEYGDVWTLDEQGALRRLLTGWNVVDMEYEAFRRGSVLYILTRDGDAYNTLHAPGVPLNMEYESVPYKVVAPLFSWLLSPRGIPRGPYGNIPHFTATISASLQVDVPMGAHGVATHTVRVSDVVAHDGDVVIGRDRTTRIVGRDEEYACGHSQSMWRDGPFLSIIVDPSSL